MLCVFTTQVSALTIHEGYEVSASDDKDDKQPVFRQLTHETVVPNYDFSFGEINYYFSEPYTDCFFLFQKSVPALWQPQPENTYFAKLFEHHIASNAP